MGVQVRIADPGTHSPTGPAGARRTESAITAPGGAPQPTRVRTQAGRRRPTANQTSMVAAARHLRPPRLRARAWVLLTLLLAAAAFGAWLWVRDSSLVRVDQVLVTGATGAEAPAVRDALE